MIRECGRGGVEGIRIELISTSSISEKKLGIKVNTDIIHKNFSPGNRKTILL
jgi:hypothetical protein